jgi:hypothetical protein
VTETLSNCPPEHELLDMHAAMIAVLAVGMCCQGGGCRVATSLYPVAAVDEQVCGNNLNLESHSTLFEVGNGQVGVKRGLAVVPACHCQQWHAG